MVGSGIIRILSECKKYGFKTPKWSDKNNILLLTFSGVTYLKNEDVNEGAKKTLEKILFYINKNPMVKTSDIEGLINRSNATTERYLKILRENNYIEYVGANKTGGYKLLNRE